ncbi:MAG: metallophosphoesterase [Desulfobacterales bacterium]|jgi:DNA repair exonuclease SbcCD nuclease subunit
MGIIRILFLADTHLGFDLPFRPRIQRLRRGPEFFANFKRALQTAVKGRVDCVVHGGDLLFRSKVPPRLVSMAFEPLKQVADQGIPVYLVPGNHERSAIPHRSLVEHPEIHIFDRPKTFLLHKGSLTLALAGFPFVRHGIRREFLHLLDQTGRRHLNADIQILCIHQAIDGATVGPADYMFRDTPEVINVSEIPADFAAALSGHIHRFQFLEKDLQGKALHTPVFYPGAIERTSFAERNEKKGYLILEFETNRLNGGRLRQWQFHELPTRPMIQLNLHIGVMDAAQLRSYLQSAIGELPQDGIVKLKIHGRIPKAAKAVLRAASLRALAPPTMNIDTAFQEHNFF